MGKSVDEDMIKEVGGKPKIKTKIKINKIQWINFSR